MTTGRHKVGPRGVWRAEEYDGLKPTVYDWVRMAAFIDGEGNIQVLPYGPTGKRKKFQVRIIIGNTNPVLAVWLKETFGGNIIIRDHNNPKWKVATIWSCTAGRAAWILWNALPWFLLKKAQADLMILLQTHIDLPRKKRVPDEVIAYRADIHRQIKKLNAKGPSVPENRIPEVTV